MDVKSLADVLPTAAALHAEAGLYDVDGTFVSWPDALARATSIARILVRAGVRPGARVAVAHPRSAASFVAVHGVLTAGATMVPLDPLGPPEALRTVLDAVSPAAIIGETNTLCARVPEYLLSTQLPVVHNGPVEPLTTLGIEPNRLIDFSTVDPDEPAALPTPHPDDVAYIMFTSGSTGVPKGIVHTHTSALAYAHGAAEVHGLRSSDRVAGTSPLHFDISTFDLYAAPLAGASVIPVSEPELRFPASLTKRLERDQASVIFMTPYQLLQLSERGDLTNRDLSHLRQVAFGGEAFAPAALHTLTQTFPPAEWLNSYGPAEVNGVTFHNFGVRPAPLATVPIGRPFPAVDVAIIDDDDHITADGVTGELVVRSASALQGYWQRDDLNADLFVELAARRYYRTGDLAHLDSDGLLQFEGRRDNRIKVRGVRIELDEIERVLEDRAEILHAVAGRVDDDGGMQHIVAWIVAADGQSIEPADLTSWCRDRLPASAVPTWFRLLSEVPTTATGKIDRARLRTSTNL